LAMAFFLGRDSRHFVRQHCIFLSDRLAASGALANDRAAAMDFQDVGARKAATSTIDKDRSGTPFSHCAPARERSLSSILHWLQCDFLVADHSEETIRTFRSARWSVRRSALRCLVFRDVIKRVAFG